MFRAALFSLPLTGGLAHARPDRLRGRSYSNANTCPCPPGPTATDGSQPYISVTTIQETVTAVITVTVPASTHTVYETIIHDASVYESDAATRSRGPDVVTITRTIINDEGRTTASGGRIDSATYLDKTLTVTYDDAASRITRTREAYKTLSPGGYADEEHAGPVGGETSTSAAAHASTTGGSQDYSGGDRGYEGGKKDDGDYDNGAGKGYDEDKKGSGKDDQSHDYDEDNTDYHDGGSKGDGSGAYPENTQYPVPTDDGSRGYPEDPIYSHPTASRSGDYASQPDACYGPPQPGRPCVTAIITGTSTRYQTVYASPTLLPATSSDSGCTLGPKIVTEYATVTATIRPTSSTQSESDAYGTSSSHTYKTSVPDIYKTASSNSTQAATSSSTTNTAAAQQTGTYLQYARRDPVVQPRNWGLGWW
ncbi:hypothetical protein B0T11DRAFT_139703 [Plectosphaerella cucumerina]|uniref:Uncharacterized protein n=1 Tax=Plectosphaerella cucumerina TaxID=40658 RepID=A0A8K0WY04_9PEZI|nr:hypothetical protein B0T11DRAFT_139703 [Plectosphaerella cucumerina]